MHHLWWKRVGVLSILIDGRSIISSIHRGLYIFVDGGSISSIHRDLYIFVDGRSIISSIHRGLYIFVDDGSISSIHRGLYIFVYGRSISSIHRGSLYICGWEVYIMYPRGVSIYLWMGGGLYHPSKGGCSFCRWGGPWYPPPTPYLLKCSIPTF